MTTIVCKKLAKMGTHMNPRKSKICLSSVEINCNVNRTYKIFRPLHEGMSNSFFDVLQFDIIFSYFIFNFRLHTPDAEFNWFEPVLGLDRVRPPGSKIVLGPIRPSGSKMLFWGQRLIPVLGWSGSKIGSGHRCGWPKPQVQPKNTLEKPKWTQILGSVQVGSSGSKFGSGLALRFKYQVHSTKAYLFLF